MNNTNKGLDFTTLNEIEEDIKIAQDTLKNVLTTSQKNAIVYLMANNVSKILNIYSDINTRKIDYPNKKVYLGDMTNIYELESTGTAMFTFTNPSKLYDFTKGTLEDNVFITLTFDIVGDYTKDTEVFMNAKFLTGGEKQKVDGSTTVVETDKRIVYGLAQGVSSNAEIKEYVKPTGKAVLRSTPTDFGYGTGTKLNLAIDGVNVKSYDLIIFGDVIEHMTVERAQTVLERAQSRCRDMIIGVPFLYPQDELYGNPWERHIQSDLTAEIFNERYPGFELLVKPINNYAYYHIGGANG